MTARLDDPVEPPPTRRRPPDDTIAVEVRGLTKIYGPARKTGPFARLSGRADEARKPAAKDVNFTVRQGEFFVIMGLSGSGKSTVLRMLNQLVEPTSGEVIIDGRNSLELTGADLRELRNRKINMVFQHFALFPHRTVRDNAAYPLAVRNEPAAARTQRADWALSTVGLGDWGDALPGELSGGMRQRVGLARALASEADILLMDEPFSALDPLIRRDMQDLLVDLQARLRRTVIFVTHDLNEAMRLGDRIMIMRNGEVVQLGTAQEILHAPADDYVADFVSDVDRSRVLTVGTVMEDANLVASVQDSPAEALARLDAADTPACYVLDADGRVAGATYADTLRAGLSRGETTWQTLLDADYRTVEARIPLSETCLLVGHHDVPLGVTDDGGRLVGVLPRATLLAALATPSRDRKDDDHA